MEFAGRSMGIGIAAGTIIGVVLWLVTGNQIFIVLFAGIGAVFGMNAGWFNRKDSDGNSQDHHGSQ
jgi:uncharacterized membrane protein YccC